MIIIFFSKWRMEFQYVHTKPCLLYLKLGIMSNWKKSPKVVPKLKMEVLLCLPMQNSNSL